MTSMFVHGRQTLRRLLNKKCASHLPLSTTMYVLSNHNMNTTTKGSVYSSAENSNDLVLIEPWNDSNAKITKLTLNNPKKMNVLSSQMMLALIEKIHIANDDILENHVIVIKGAGKIFSSGHDLKELLQLSNEGNEDGLKSVFKICTDLMFAVRNSHLPILSMCHGIGAHAAGLQLACASDMILASQECQFSTPGVNIGLFCSTPAIELSRNVGRKIAMEMLLTGQPINAQRAYEVGLINVCASDEVDLAAKAEEMAMKIVAKSRPVVALGKQGFYNQIDMNLRNAHESAGNCMVNNLFIPDSREGLTAFIEKRHPEWSHKTN